MSGRADPVRRRRLTAALAWALGAAVAAAVMALYASSGMQMALASMGAFCAW